MKRKAGLNGTSAGVWAQPVTPGTPLQQLLAKAAQKVGGTEAPRE